jgi:hypothetical protein
MAIGILIGDFFSSEFLSNFDLTHAFGVWKGFWLKKMAQNPPNFEDFVFFSNSPFS